MPKKIANPAAEMELKSALLSTGLLQPVESKSMAGHVEVLCRQVQGQEKAWLQTAQLLLRRFEDEFKGKPAELHLCRRYVLKEGQMVFGWHISVDSKNKKLTSQAVSTLANELEGVRVSLTEPPKPQEPKKSRRPLAPGVHPQRVPQPRPPGVPGTVHGDPPPASQLGMRTIVNKMDESGKRTIIEEFPIPHVHKELNIPNEKGKGARYTGGGP